MCYAIRDTQEGGTVGMSRDTFSRREVTRSFRKFNDCVTDLFAAVFQTWGDAFTHLIHHCENDPVMRVVTEPLRANTAVNAKEWYQKAVASRGSMVGSGRYTLPTDDDERTALLYHFLLLVETGEVDYFQFCITFYGTSKGQDAVATFNREIVQKFTREVSYRLAEVTSDIGDVAEVPREAMLVFHYHANTRQEHSMNFHGPVQGANVAGPGATITGSTATYSNNAELAEALKALKPLVGTVAVEQRQAVEAALDVLIQATGKDANLEEVRSAVDTVAKASPPLAERLKDMVSRLGHSLTSSAIFQAIKSYFDIR